MKDCPFCEYHGPSPILARYLDCVVFEPLNPVTPGHVLVVPKSHYGDALESSLVTGDAFGAAVLYAQEVGVGPCNLITSVGREATQTIEHLHVHIVPRREGDGLALPWTAKEG